MSIPRTPSCFGRYVRSGVKRESVFLVESLKKIAEDPKLLEPNAMSDPFDLTSVWTKNSRRL